MPSAITSSVLQNPKRTRLRAWSGSLQKACTGTPATPAAPAQGGAASTSLPVGPPLTAEEKDGLALAVKSCWSMPAGLRDLTDLKITVAAELQPDGSVKVLAEVRRVGAMAQMVDPAQPGETLRVNGRAALSCDPELCAQFEMAGKLPASVMVVDVEAVYFQ